MQNKEKMKNIIRLKALVMNQNILFMIQDTVFMIQNTLLVKYMT